MRRALLVSLVLVGIVVPLVGDASADPLLRRHRLRRFSDADSMQLLPYRAPDDAPDCSPLFPGIPDILAPSVFDPGAFDEISVGGDGRVLAYPSGLQDRGLPGTRREIVVLPEGKARERITAAAGHHDDPDVQFDRFGRRIAFSAWDDAASETFQDVFVQSTTRGGNTNVRNVTDFGGNSAEDSTAFEPALAARTRERHVGGGIKLEERDARLVFVSTGDLDRDGRPPFIAPGNNASNFQQLFVWFERQNRFLQLTRVDSAEVRINRPCISRNGRIVYFESTGDLSPNAVNPNDSTAVGNPNGVRQIFRWVAGRGIRQITWSDADCFAPRCSDNGRTVYFCSAGDPVVGGNPEGNTEVFRWRARGPASRRLRQVTATIEGDSALPRPTRNGRDFTFYSTASVPTDFDAFGQLTRECLPKAFLWNRGRVRLLTGSSDAEVLQLILDDPNAVPPLTGPPVPSDSFVKIHFASSDPIYDPTGDTGQASAFAWHIVRATRFPARRR